MKLCCCCTGMLLTRLSSAECWASTSGFWTAFRPRRIPDLWTPDLLTPNRRGSPAPARGLATFTAAGDVRRGLESARALKRLTKRSGWAKKREHLTAQLRVARWTPRATASTAALTIAGAGVAGLDGGAGGPATGLAGDPAWDR